MATNLYRVPSSTGSQTKFTFSFWWKNNCNHGSDKCFFSSGLNSSNYFMIRTTGNEQLELLALDNGSATMRYKPTRYYRDNNAFYHIVIAVDTTQSGGNRLKWYTNGVRETAFDLSTEPNQNTNLLYINDTTTHAIGRKNVTQDKYFQGTLSHYHFTDGYVYDASAFGSTDSVTGEWQINTSPSVTYGTNGFFILKDGNSVTDQSGNNNNWIVGNGTLTKTEDCPSNVFATGNPLHRGANLTDATFSNGNTTHEGTSSGGSYPYTFSTLAASSGKWYAEFKRVNGETMMGIGRGKAATYPGSDTYEYTYFSNGILYNNDSSLGSYGNALNNNDIVGVAMDLDNNAAYWSINGVWQNSGVPTSGASKTGAQSITAASSNGYGVYHFVYGKGGSTVTDIEANFGNGYFGTTAVSSAGTNASGNGIFEYDVPTGYTALSTKGLNL